MQENLDETKYTKPVTINVGELDIHWHPLSEGLSGLSSNEAGQIADTVNDFIRALRSINGQYISVTPEGPTLETSVRDLYTVIWAVNTLYGDDNEITVDGDAPTMADMGLDKNSNYDADGNIVVR